MKKSAFAFLFLLTTLPFHASAQETYADMTVQSVPNWVMTQMQTFPGSVPSRMWIFSKNDEEVAVAAMVTEGIENGLRDQNHGTLAKMYLDGLISGWNGKSEGPETGSNAAFCAGEAGYKTVATFGDRKFDYYTCMMMNRERTSMFMITTWGPEGTPEDVITRRLMTYVQACSFTPFQ